MAKQLTKFGLAILRSAIAKQDARARAAGAEIGEAAGANCDWHDNFAYEDALRRHEMESSRLAQLVATLSNAELIEVQEQARVVAVGTTVDLLSNGERKSFTIGGSQEESPDKKLISLESPMARAIVGLHEGDTTEFRIGPRLVEIKIETIHPPSARYHALMSDYLVSLGIEVR
jgi:transcription elongation factor GreA